MTHPGLVCAVLFLTAVTTAQLVRKPHFTSSMLNLEARGDGKHSITFDWDYQLTPEVDVREMYFGFMTGRFFSSVVKKFIRGSYVRVIFLYSGTVMRKLLPGRENDVLDDGYVAVDVIKTRFFINDDRRARFTLRNVRVSDEGKYFCIIRLSNGSDIRSWATLKVTQVPPRPVQPYAPLMGNCRRPSVTDCSRIGYQYTSVDSDQTQITKMKKLYGAVIKKKRTCETAFRDLLCYMYAPKCDVSTKVVYKPCRSMCENVRRKCEYVWYKYKNYGLGWPASLDCESLPDKYCLGSSSKPRQKLICQGNVWKPKCPPSFALTIVSAQFGRSSNWFCGNNRRRCRADVTSIMRRLCEGKRSCPLKINQKMFGNLCASANGHLSVKYSCYSSWKPSKEHNNSWVPVRPCRPLLEKKCQAFGYTFTQIPTAFKSTNHASTEMYKYWRVVQSKCSSELSLLLCSVYFPRCNPLNMVSSLPCRSLCTKVKRDCVGAFKSLGMNWPSELDCAKLPEQKCVLSSSAPSDHSSNLIYPPQLTGAGKCQKLTIRQCKGLGYRYTILPSTFEYPTQSYTESLLNVGNSLMPTTCSTRHLRLFMCSRYAPKCEPSTKTIIPPCRAFCKKISVECADELRRIWGGRGQPLNCSWMPERNCISSLDAPAKRKFLFVNYQRYVAPGYRKTAIFDCSTTQIDAHVTLYFRFRNKWRKVTRSIFNDLRESMGVFTRYSISYYEMGSYRCKAVSKNWEVIQSPIIKLVRSLPTRPSPGQLRLTVQLQHGVQQNATFEFNYSVPLEGELEKIEFFTTNLRNGRWILAIAKYVVRGESSFSYRVNPTVVRRLHPQGIYKYSYYEDLKVLRSRLITENNREAKFTLRNVVLKDRGSYYCKVTLRNAKPISYFAYLNVIPAQTTTRTPTTTSRPASTSASHTRVTSSFGTSFPTFPVIPTSCEPLTISACQNLGYNQTASANLFGGLNQSTRGQWLQQLSPLIKENCSVDFTRFICSMTAPQCNPVTKAISFPCRSLCQSVKNGCRSAFKKLGIDWPSTFDCTSMPQWNCVKPSAGPTVAPSCETITIPACKNVGYTSARFPNYLGHTTQAEAGLEVHQFFPLIKVRCSPNLAALLCSVYAPPCNANKTLLLPCREICESAKNRCEGLMNRFGFQWPESLNCGRFPLQSTKRCFVGKQQSQRSPRPSTAQRSIRLVGGRSPYEGRLEIYHNGKWWSICNDNWNRQGLPNANVACRMLGLGRAVKVFKTTKKFGQGKGNFLLDDVDCRGDEADLLKCQHRTPLGDHDCFIGNEVAMRCRRS